MNTPTRQQIETTLKNKGYKWFENGDYDVNLVGVRSPDKDGKITTYFNYHFLLPL